jgi:hypothetical protein
MLGVNMFQSNLSAFAIALVGMASFGSGGAASTSTILLMIDAMIGLESFRRGNTRRILNYLSVRIPGLSRLQELKQLENNNDEEYKRHDSDDDFTEC